MAIVTREGSLFIWQRGFTIAGPTAGSFSQAGGILVLPATRLSPAPLVFHAKRHLHTMTLNLLGSVFQLLGISQLSRVSLLIDDKTNKNQKTKAKTKTKPPPQQNKNPEMFLESQRMWVVVMELGRKVSHSNKPNQTEETSESYSFPTIGYCRPLSLEVSTCPRMKAFPLNSLGLHMARALHCSPKA